MTDKDPKDMTTSELLRLADSHPCSMCHLVMEGDESCATTGCASWAYRLADKIDAELALALDKGIKASLRHGAMIWAKANGWPDFREGEDFGHWLRRCALKRPVFDDGDPMQIGNLVSSKLFGNVSVGAIEYTATDVFVKDAPDGDWSTSILVDKPLKRPAPEVLGADGLPIKVGDTVYELGRDEVLKVYEVNSQYVHTKTSSGGLWNNLTASYLTHTPPDTQQKIDDDATMHPAAYCAAYGIDLGDDPDREKSTTSMIADLLRRQREYDKRKGGAE